MTDKDTTDPMDKPIEYLNNLSRRQFHELVEASEHTLLMLSGRNPEAYITLVVELVVRMVMDRDEAVPPSGDLFLHGFKAHLDKVVVLWRASIKERMAEDKSKLN